MEMEKKRMKQNWRRKRKTIDYKKEEKKEQLIILKIVKERCLTRPWESSSANLRKSPLQFGSNNSVHNNSNHSRRKPPQSKPKTERMEKIKQLKIKINYHH